MNVLNPTNPAGTWLKQQFTVPKDSLLRTVPKYLCDNPKATIANILAWATLGLQQIHHSTHLHLDPEELPKFQTRSESERLLFEKMKYHNGGELAVRHQKAIEAILRARQVDKAHSRREAQLRQISAP